MKNHIWICVWYRGSDPAPYAWQTSTSPPNPPPQFCRWAVRAWEGLKQSLRTAHHYLNIWVSHTVGISTTVMCTLRWVGPHVPESWVYWPQGFFSFSIWAQLLVQLLDSSHLSEHRLASFSQNLKDGGLSIVTLATLQMTSKLQDHLCPSWWSICFGNRRSCYATLGGLESMILLPQCPGC